MDLAGVVEISPYSKCTCVFKQRAPRQDSVCISLVLITGPFPASTSSFCLDSFAFCIASFGPSALAFAFRLLLSCLCLSSRRQLLGQEVCELQLEAVRQMTAIRFAPCTSVRQG